MQNNLDPRLHAFREDLADIRLQGSVDARRFVAGAAGRIIVPVANVYGSPSPAASVTTQALLGETLQIFESANGYHWVQLDADNYVGYIAAQEVDYGAGASTHDITAPLAHVFSQADVKSRPLELLPLGARVQAMGGSNDEWLSLARGGFIKAAATRTRRYTDLADAAAQLIGAPYLWGGRSALGIDCSGLVQLAINMTGKISPRDSDQQAALLGTEIPKTKLQRNDLVFFKGHVGIMWNESQLLHANAFTMNVVLEPLEEVERRAAVTVCRRV